MIKKTLAMAALATLALAHAAEARDQITIVGSSTVFPFSTAVAEQFGKIGKFKTPVVESNGTGGGIRLFCSGVGADFPDIADASRAITASEVELCAKNGVTSISEITIGYDGIVFVDAKQSGKLALTREDVYKAIAKDVVVGGKLTPNPYKKWSDINPALPAPNHGTRDALVELVLNDACGKVPEIKALDKDAKKQACEALREDGAFVEVAENYSVTVQKVGATPGSLGIVGFSFGEQSADKVTMASIDGVDPTYESIAANKYPVSRPLFFYVKKQHVGVIPGLKEFIAEYTSEKSWGKEGYLADRGLIALPDAVRKDAAKRAAELPELKN